MKSYKWVNKKPDVQYRWTKETGWIQKPQQEYWQIEETQEVEKENTK